VTCSQIWRSSQLRFFRGRFVANVPCSCHLDFFAAGLVNTNAFAVSLQFDAHTISLTRCGIENGHIGLVNRHGLFDDAASCALHGVWLGVLFNDIDTVDQHMGIGCAGSNFAALTLIPTCDDDDFIACANLVHGASLQYFRSQGHDLHELLGTQFTRDRAEDAGANRLQLGIQQHGCVAIEFDEGAIATADALGSANHHSTVDLAFFDATTRGGFFDAHFDDVANTCIATPGPAEHLDAQHGLGAGVVGHIIKVSIKEAAPRGRVKKGEIYSAVVVRTAKGIRRGDGSLIKFDGNAAVLLNAKLEPIGTRIFGPVTRELRTEKFMKIVSLAPEVL